MISSLIAGGLLAAAAGPAAADFSACQIGPENMPRLEAECLWFIVPENHSAPDGRQIRLRVARLKARAAEPADAPLVFIAGGPGQSSLDSFVGLRQAFAAVRQQRDILLVDQRGTGQSKPLRCPRLEEEGLEADIEPEQVKAWAKDCVASLDADVRWYSTIDAIADLELLREHLGYPQFALYGISYGTRVVQEYLRRHPDRIYAAVMDGVVPASEVLGTEIAIDAQRALDMMLDRCAEDALCNEAFPGLRAQFEAVRRQLDKGPFEVEVRDAYTGELKGTTMSWSRFAMLLRMFSYAPESVSLLPLLIADAARGDWQSVAAASTRQEEELEDMINIGMHNSVVCAEDAPFMQPEQRKQANDGAYLGMTMLDGIDAMCDAWPVREIPASFKEPLETDRPVLVLSGEADPVTPPENGEKIMPGLSNALHLVARGQGHGIAWRGCMPRLVANFYATAEPARLETDCLENFVADPFFINRNSPALSTDAIQASEENEHVAR